MIILPTEKLDVLEGRTFPFRINGERYFRANIDENLIFISVIEYGFKVNKDNLNKIIHDLNLDKFPNINEIFNTYSNENVWIHIVSITFNENTWYELQQQPMNINSMLTKELYLFPIEISSLGGFRINVITKFKNIFEEFKNVIKPQLDEVILNNHAYEEEIQRIVLKCQDKFNSPLIKFDKSSLR